MNNLNLKDLIKYRTELFGLSAIWILFFHIQSYVGYLPIPRVPTIIGMGNSGVDIFLFLSAIGLYYSYRKNTLKEFYIHRVKRVIIPYLLLAIIFFIIYNFIILKDGFWEFVLNLSTINFWLKGDHPTWYVAFMIIVYAIYPLLYKFFQKNKWIAFITLTVISVVTQIVLWKNNSIVYANAERALSRIPIFLIGLLFAHLIEENKQLSKTGVVIAFIVVAIGIFIYPVTFFDVPLFVTRYLYIATTISLIIVWTVIRNSGILSFISKPLLFFGEMSFEIYIGHVFIIRLVRDIVGFQIISWWIWYIILPIISILLAQTVSLIVKKVNERIEVNP